MDHFLEEVVIQKNRTMNDIMYILSWVVLVLSGITAMMEVSGVLQMLSAGVPFTSLLMDIGLALVSAAICAFTYLRNDRLKTEFEYTFTNGALDFAMVFNNKKRKNLGTLNVRTIDAFGKVNSDQFQRYVSMKDVKQDRWFLNRGAELYYFYFKKNDNKRLIIFEPSEEMVKNIQHYLPQGMGKLD